MPRALSLFAPPPPHAEKRGEKEKSGERSQSTEVAKKKISEARRDR